MAETQESLHFLDYWRVLCARKEIVIAVSLLVVLTGILVSFAMPQVYMASVVIAVKADTTPDVEVFRREITPFNPLFLRTQFEIIQSTPIIEEVVQRCELDRKLAAAYGYDALSPDSALQRTLRIVSRSTKVQQYRDTNLIEVQIYLSEPKPTARLEVANVANMVAEVYRDQTIRRRQRETETALKALHESLEEHRRKTNEAAVKLEEIRQKYEIAVLSSEVGADSALDKMSLASLERQRMAASADVASKKARYDSLVNLSPADREESAAYVANDPALASLMGQKREAEVELSRLTMAALGPKHPDVERARGVVEELGQKVKEALNGLMTSLRVEHGAAAAALLALETELDTLKMKEIRSEGSGYREFQEAKENLEHTRKIRDALEIRYLQERIMQSIPRTTVDVIEPAKVPDERDHVSPNIPLNALLSVVVGLGAGIGLAFFVEYLDTSVKTIEDVERNIGLPVLGVIPQRVRPFIDDTAEAAHAEAYRVLRTNIRFSKKMPDGKCVCVTSGSVGEGKSLTMFNLACVCAKLGDKVLVVDADLHRPRQHTMAEVPKAPGLANILVGEVAIEDAIMTTRLPNLDVLPSGKLASGAHGLLDTRKMREFIDGVREQYDYLFFDGPPILGVSDASLLVREMDGVLLVIQHRKYPMAISNRAKDMVNNIGANLIGVVLNNINISRDYSYYYQHYYSYPQSHQSARKA